MYEEHKYNIIIIMKNTNSIPTPKLSLFFWKNSEWKSLVHIIKQLVPFKVLTIFCNLIITPDTIFESQVFHKILSDLKCPQTMKMARNNGILFWVFQIKKVNIYRLTQKLLPFFKLLTEKYKNIFKKQKF